MRADRLVTSRVPRAADGALSARRFDFPTVVQHDSVLRPNECGGPVINVEGQVVGINIARASRVATYTIPAATVVPLIQKLKK